MPYRWSDDYGARIGIMPRGGSSADVRGFDVEPCYVFHPFNAFGDGESVTVDVARYPQLWRDTPGAFDAARAHRWIFNLRSGSVNERPLDDRSIEFPRVDERLTGLEHRYAYAAQSGSTIANDQTALVKYDLETGKCTVHEFGPGFATSEGVFVPAGPDAGEDEGWVLAYVYDAARNTSDLVVLDARDFAGEPQATVALPQRVPMGFHGSWVSAAD